MRKIDLICVPLQMSAEKLTVNRNQMICTPYIGSAATVHDGIRGSRRLHREPPW